MMRKLMMAVLAVLGLGMASCAQKGVRTVGAGEFAKGIAADGVQLVDVRTPGEYASGHIAHAANIDVSSDSFKDEAVKILDAERPVYVYCHSGMRSLRAAGILAKAGFQVVNLRGGYLEWTLAGKPTVK